MSSPTATTENDPLRKILDEILDITSEGLTLSQQEQLINIYETVKPYQNIVSNDKNKSPYTEAISAFNLILSGLQTAKETLSNSREEIKNIAKTVAETPISSKLVGTIAALSGSLRAIATDADAILSAIFRNTNSNLNDAVDSLHNYERHSRFVRDTARALLKDLTNVKTTADMRAVMAKFADLWGTSANPGELLSAIRFLKEETGDITLKKAHRVNEYSTKKIRENSQLIDSAFSSVVAGLTYINKALPTTKAEENKSDKLRTSLENKALAEKQIKEGFDSMKAIAQTLNTGMDFSALFAAFMKLVRNLINGFRTNSTGAITRKLDFAAKEAGLPQPPLYSEKALTQDPPPAYSQQNTMVAEKTSEVIAESSFSIPTFGR